MAGPGDWECWQIEIFALHRRKSAQLLVTKSEVKTKTVLIVTNVTKPGLTFCPARQQEQSSHILCSQREHFETELRLSIRM